MPASSRPPLLCFLRRFAIFVLSLHSLAPNSSQIIRRVRHLKKVIPGLAASLPVAEINPSKQIDHILPSLAATNVTNRMPPLSRIAGYANPSSSDLFPRSAEKLFFLTS